MKAWQQEYISMIEDCMDNDSRLTDWERKFLDSLLDRLDGDDQYLTTGQIEKLEQIYEKVTR